MPSLTQAHAHTLQMQVRLPGFPELGWSEPWRLVPAKQPALSRSLESRTTLSDDAGARLVLDVSVEATGEHSALVCVFCKYVMCVCMMCVG